MENMEGRILTREELMLPLWKEKAKCSMEMAGAAQTKEKTEIVRAQESLLNFILNLGGVRREVYEYLLFPHFQNMESVASIRSLLCNAAPLEWVMLAVKALEKDEIAGVIYVDEITEAYQAGIKLERVQHYLREANTAFEMCQFRIQSEAQTLPDKMSRSDTMELPDKMTRSDTMELSDTMSSSRQEEITGTVAGAVMAAMRDFMKELKGDCMIKDTKIGREPWQETLQQNKTQDMEALQWENSQPDRLLQDDVQENSELEKESQAEVILKEMEQTLSNEEEPREQELPDFPDGKEIMDSRILLTNLEEEEKKYRQRVSFFQILLNNHMRKAFAKLDVDTQVSKIFEIMIERKYGKERILAIKRLMNGGMTNEFIFSLLEKDLSEEELVELTDTLLTSDKGTGDAKENMERDLEMIPEKYESGVEELI